MSSQLTVFYRHSRTKKQQPSIYQFNLNITYKVGTKVVNLGESIEILKMLIIRDV